MSATILFRIGILIVILLLIDWYAFQAIKTALRSSSLVKWIYWGLSIGVLLFLLYGILSFDRNSGPNPSFQILIATMILFIVPKLLLIIFMFGEDIWRLLSGTVMKIMGKGDDAFLADRRKFISQTALALASVPFLGILHGIWKGKYNYRVIRQDLSFKDLPEEFDGLTITHISDVHSGSFDNAEKVKYGIDLINEQESDLILFTGDLVNNRANEMEPWKDLFSTLKAPMGKFSILGNHDYGDYVNWDSAEHKAQNMQDLFKTHKDIGFNLLLNTNVKLEKEGASIDLIGVENWGHGFVQHGDLEKATADLEEKSFKILMSHDPSHFDEQVKKFGKFIHLTLSGHTHGMQFGIEIPGFIKFSPVKFRYPKWAGLYEELGRYLYVNRGFGFLAFPGRVGIWPEVTVLKLTKDRS